MIKNLIVTLIASSFLSCNSSNQKQNGYFYEIALERLRYISGNLEVAVESMREDNRQLLIRIEQEVANKGNRSYDLEIVNRGRELMELTDQLFDQLASIKSNLLELSEQDLSSIEQQNVLMFDQNKGAEIETLINNYVNEINELSNKKHPRIFPDLEGTEYSIVEIYFKDSPAIATLGTIASFESEICNYERAILTGFASVTGTR